MYKLLATDIDDTLLAADGSLPEANRTALRSLHTRGVAIVFSSGRAVSSLRKVAAGIIAPDDDEYLIAFNGARVVTALSGRPIFEQLLSPEAVRRVVEYCRENGLMVQGYDHEAFLVEKDGEFPAEYARNTSMEYRVVPDIAEALPGGSAKLLVVAPNETLLRHLPAIEELSMADAEESAGSSVSENAGNGGGSDGGARGRLFQATFSKPHYLEVVRPGIDKGTALRKIAAHLGIGIEETIAVGDSLNDIEMVEAAGLGLAVANARDELKRVADIVLERTADEAVMEEIEERFFG